MTDEDRRTLLQRIADLELELKRERARCARATASAINLRKMLRLIPADDQNIPSIKMRDIDALVKKVRAEAGAYEQTELTDVHALCDAVESAIPALDLLQKRLEDGCYVVAPDEMNGHLWVLFRRDGEGIASGESLRSMLLNLMWVDTGDGSTE